MKKSALVIIPVVSSFLFMYGCGPTPHTDQPTAYQFTFEGTNCNIEYEDKYETKIYEGDKNLTFTINPEYDFVLIQSDVQITGENTTYDEQTHVLTISEVVGDVIVTANATTKPTFTFRGENCDIWGERTIIKSPLKKGAKNVTFQINVYNDYFLTKDDLTITGDNVKYNQYNHKLTITEVTSSVEIEARAYAIKSFGFTGTEHCSINGSQNIVGEPLKEGDTDVQFTISVDAGYSISNVRIVDPVDDNTEYDPDTRTITIHKVANNVEVTATTTALTKYKVNGTLSNCHYYEEPKENGYIAGSKVKLKFIPNKAIDHIYGMPKLSDVSLSEGDYTYDSATGMLTFIMPESNVSFTATSTSTVNILHITSDYTIIEEGNYRVAHQNSYQINDAYRYYNLNELGLSTTSGTPNKEIILTNTRNESKELTAKLGKEEDYAIEVQGTNIVIGYKTNFARICAVDRLLTDFLYDKDGINVPTSLNVRGTCKREAFVKVFFPDDCPIRDPFIYRDGTDYYMYGTSGSFDGDEWRVYGAKDTFKTGWELISHNIVEETDDIDTKRWAPEMHKYGDNYYLFTTYSSKETDKRGVTIFKSSSLTGGFKMISKNSNNLVQPGHITNDSVISNTIDGSLYVTQDGVPWMVYVDEWVDNPPDNKGGMDIVKFKDNLTEPLSEIDESTNVELFKSYDPEWTDDRVTDGCFIHRLKDGGLVMIWSNDDASDRYAIGLVCNREGDSKINDPKSWVHQKRLLYAKDIYEDAPDGGHGMIFDDPNGNLYLCLHGPNDDGFKYCKARIIPIKEAYGTLVWDIYNHSV
ncbi:MAG: family 43 glycosylhydrolase [Bacilli bacterium]|nr:family 43 glycosylhydrolase [Bacilli bacterium]